MDSQPLTTPHAQGSQRFFCTARKMEADLLTVDFDAASGGGGALLRTGWGTQRRLLAR